MITRRTFVQFQLAVAQAYATRKANDILLKGQCAENREMHVWDYRVYIKKKRNHLIFEDIHIVLKHKIF